ncbi:serine hydrolase domain-containing protein [Hyphomonas oceanitis]|uniref:Beta-lactamase n=1 Tax=Hyphomonas oceanitis SCH89 TaxID=1280953 RepID=A0A059G4M5_9PROT|nr:serine hydrolase domain-containing protein [Hyphomonas oceanitis]KDA01530.1 beta-lactamase [Hyphomonas oceanitis SCH89]
MELTSRRRMLALAASSPFAGWAASCASPGRGPVPLRGVRFQGTGQFLDQLVETGQIAGGALRISQQGEVLYTHHAGKADIASGKAIRPDTIYRAYSMTKPVTAAAIMMLADEGKLSLDDPVREYVPEFSDLRVLASPDGEPVKTVPAGEMRIIHLLAHTSGLSNSWTPGPLAPLYQKAGLVSASYPYDPDFAGGLTEVARQLAEIPLQFQPGSQWLYSISPDIAGLVVERIKGQRFGAFLQEKMFDPLGMPDTGFHVPAEKAGRLAAVYALKEDKLVHQEPAESSPFLKAPYVESGSAGLVTTLDDYGRFAAMLAGLGTVNGVRVLSEDRARAMMSPHVDEAVLGPVFGRFMGFATGGSGKGMGMALGGAVLTDPAASRVPGVRGEYTWGGAASTTFIAVPEIGLEATLMTQLFPSGTLPLRDLMKKAVYDAIL